MDRIYCNRKTDNRKDKYIRARVTKHEKGLIENHALLKGFTTSEYIMHLILKDMDGEQGNIELLNRDAKKIIKQK